MRKSTKIVGIIILLLILALILSLTKRSLDNRSKAKQTTSVPPPNIPPPKKDPRVIPIIHYDQDIIPNQVIVKFKNELKTKNVTNIPEKSINYADLDTNAIPPVLSQINQKYQVTHLLKVFNPALKNDNLSKVYTLTLGQTKSLDQAIYALKASNQIEYAQPNYKLKVSFHPNDYFYNKTGDWGQPYPDLWGLKTKLVMEKAWDKTKGRGITVAVVDTGIDYNHPDIAANVVKGWNFINDNNDPLDDNGHGTHVAGIIGAIGNNSIGLIGVAPESKVMAIKVFDKDGVGGSDQAAQGILYAAQNGARVINNSWGCSSPCPTNPVIEDAVRTVEGNYNTSVVFAAGNSGSDILFYSPQNMADPKPIVVASSDFNNLSSYFSNYGYLIDVTAPGGPELDPYLSFSNILSLKASNCSPSICTLILGGNYLLLAGTSMAAPYVSGLAALILSQNPTLPPETVRQIIRVTSSKLGISGYDPLFGSGLISALPALSTTSVLTTKITSPAPGSFINPSLGQLTIMGTASGSSFKNYQLSYQRRDDKVKVWNPISNSNSQVLNGNLGNWSIGNLTTGEYLIKLETFDLLGHSFSDFDQLFVQSPQIQQITSQIGSNRDSLHLSDNLLVWEDGRNGDCSIIGANCDIYLYDFSQNKEVQITTNPSTQRWPDISGNRIVWQDYRSGNYEIYTCTYNPLTNQCDNETKLSSGSPNDKEFTQIDGNYVVWTDFRSLKGHIYLYDFSTNRVRTITTPKGSPVGPPAISGNIIAWPDGRNPNYYHIYACTYNPKTGLCPERRISSGNRNQYDVHISGNRIVWTDYATLGPVYDFSGDIFYCYYTVSSCPVRNLTKNPADQYGNQVSGNLVVWQDNRNNEQKLYSETVKWRNYDIYLYDFNSKTRHQITSSLIEAEDAVVNSQRVVFIRRDQGGPWGYPNIYSVDLPPSFKGPIDTEADSP